MIFSCSSFFRVVSKFGRGFGDFLGFLRVCFFEVSFTGFEDVQPSYGSILGFPTLFYGFFPSFLGCSMDSKLVCGQFLALLFKAPLRLGIIFQQRGGAGICLELFHRGLERFGNDFIEAFVLEGFGVEMSVLERVSIHAYQF